MSNLSNTMGEGGGAGWEAPALQSDYMKTPPLPAGYGTHDGQGNVPTDAPYQKGTGYDEHGQVATSFGKWPVAYDPVTGMAVEHVTGKYDMGGADVGGGAGGELPGTSGGGLVDVSAAAPDHSAVASPELQRAVQDFFENRGAAAAAVEQERAEEAGPRQPAAGEGTGQGVAERMDAGAYLPDQPELTGSEAEAWRRHRP
ncbi:hypothetical protein ABPG75_013836 [Micractinium tetrahymenae]